MKLFFTEQVFQDDIEIPSSTWGISCRESTTVFVITIKSYRERSRKRVKFPLTVFDKKI